MTALSALTLTGCSGSEDADPVFPTAAADLPDATALSDAGSTIPHGEWGVLQDYDSIAEPTVSTLAVKTGAVRRGGTSDFDDVMIPGGLPEDSVAYYANIVYSALEGSHSISPMHELVAVDTTTGEYATMLSVPSSLENCPIPATEGATDLRQATVGCLVFVMPKGSTPDAVVFTASHADELDTDVSPLTFALPTAEKAS